MYLGDAEHPYAVFDFTPTYSGDGPKAWLGGYAGYVQADALKQYDPLFNRAPPRPTEVGCFAHARRKFHDARASDPARAHEALARIRRLYDIEAEVSPLDDSGRLAARQARTRPLLDALFAWLEEQPGKVLPKSPIGAAIGYALADAPAGVRPRLLPVQAGPLGRRLTPPIVALGRAGEIEPLSGRVTLPPDLHSKDPEQGFQQFVSRSTSDEQPVLAHYRALTAEHFGSPEEVLVLDDTGFPKRGRHSVGVSH